MATFRSTKIFDGFSTVFRQWKAEGTHCRFLHGYDVYFKVTFEGELDERNWTFDFGGMKRAKNTIEGMNPKAYFDFLLDHTTVVAEDDPELEMFKELNRREVIQLRIVPAVGAERFAEFLYHKISTFLEAETEGRVKVTSVELFEHNKNTAIYIP